MAWPELDTKAWNLGAIVIGVAACGPLVPIPADTDGDTTPNDDDDTPNDTSAESFPTTATDSIGPGCGGGPPCPPNYVCVDGYCQYDYYCSTCCDGECGGYYDCFAHEDCGSGYYCDYYNCRVLPYLYNCDPGGALGQELIPNTGAGTSLAFGDVTGDGIDDLAIFSEPTSWVLLGPSLSELVPVDLFGGGAGGGVVATEFNGDVPLEFTFSIFDSDTLLAFAFFGGTPEPIAVGEPALAWPVSGDFDGDGRDDIAGRSGSSIGSVFSDGVSYHSFSTIGVGQSAFAVGLLGPSTGEDIVYADGYISFAELWPGGGQGSVIPELYPWSVRTPAVGDFDGNGVDDIAAIAPDSGGYYGVITTWAQLGPGDFSRTPYMLGPQLAPSDDGVFPIATGDFDGDGSEDLAIGGFSRLTILFGSLGGGATFSCWSEIPIDGTARHIAVGDHDGNGLSDLAWTDAIATTRVRLSG